MNVFFEELKNTRLARGLTLEEIEEKTRIGIQFLTALEEGKTSILPGPYVRAFVREYAGAVGLDPNETLRRFAEATGTEPPPPIQTFDENSPSRSEPPDEKPSGSLGVRPWTKIALGSTALLALLVVVWLLMPKGDRRQVQEIPFETAVKEAERRAPVQEQHPAGAKPPSSPTSGDSLTLSAYTSESVWVEVIVDDQRPRDLMIPAKQQAVWRARERFTVSVGNAGGIRFKLDSRDLEAVGKPGQVVRNVTISRSGVVIP